MLSDASYIIVDVDFKHKDVLQVYYTKNEEMELPTPNTNVVLAAFVTAQGRLKLWAWKIKRQLKQLAQVGLAGPIIKRSEEDELGHVDPASDGPLRCFPHWPHHDDTERDCYWISDQHSQRTIIIEIQLVWLIITTQDHKRHRQHHSKLGYEAIQRN